MSVLRFVVHGLATASVLTVGGCSDPATPAPQGAFNVTFGNAIGTGVTCPAMQPAQLQVGAVGGAQYASVIDGEDGVTVTCTVSKSGAGFRASGSIVKGTSRFSLAPVTVGEGNSNQGRVSVAGANTAGKPYGPTAETLCDFQMIKGAEGFIWLAFECPHVISGSSDNEQCSLYNGYLVFENCES